LSHVDRSPGTRGRLRWVGLAALVAALGLCLMPGVAAAKKDRVKVMSQNLYLGSDLNRAVRQGLANHTDGIADEAGTIVNNVNTNNFNVRARTIANFIKKNKADLVGLQEAALWRLQIPSDGGGGALALSPTSLPAGTPLIDYTDTLLDALNKKALSKKGCKKFHEKHPGKQCYRGYKLVRSQQEADVEQPSDIDHNNGPDGQTFDISTTSGASDIGKWLLGNDDVGIEFGEPPSPPFPTDANFDSTGSPDASTPYAGDPTGNTPDPVSPITGAPGADCTDAVSPTLVDNNPLRGPRFMESTTSGPWPFDGFDRDINPATPGIQTPVCLFHGIDGDGRLTMHDAIIVRRGAGIKAKNAKSANYAPQDTLSFGLFGKTLSFTRGWVSADVSVRGKRFHLVDTHLESENQASFREDQARELVAPGGPASQPNTVLIGDLNSDPSIAPTNLPDGDGDSNIAYNRIAAAGFRSLTSPTPTAGASSATGHTEILTNPGATNLTRRIDHILTNSPSINATRSLLLDRFVSGLWQSDHAGVLSVLKVPGGKKK
jgi:endonuclease/exonuclease/phosphatase family metal-dependent hydrolase